MIAVLERGCPLKTKAEIVRFIENSGFRVHVSEDRGQSLVGVIGPGAESLADDPAHVIPGHDPLVLKRFPAAKPELEGMVARLD